MSQDDPYETAFNVRWYRERTEKLSKALERVFVWADAEDEDPEKRLGRIRLICRSLDLGINENHWFKVRAAGAP